MDLILTILKVGGIVVSGALGILGTTTETRDKETNRLTRWGKWALCLTISGLVVALGAQMFESLKQKSEEAESRKRTEKILLSLEETVDGIGQIITPITKKISINAIYELPPNDSIPTADVTVRKLQDYFDQYLSSNPRIGNDSSIGIFDVDYFIYHVEPKPGIAPKKLVVVRLDRFLQEISTSPELQGIKKLLESLRMPSVRLELGKAPMKNHSIPLIDLTIELSSHGKKPASDVAMYYALPSRRILVHWHYDFPREEWQSHGKFISLHGLASAYCYLGLDWSEGYPDPMRPILVDLQFDDYPSASLDTFRPTNDKYVVEARMPSRPEIMSGEVSRFFMPYPLTSKLYP